MLISYVEQVSAPPAAQRPACDLGFPAVVSVPCELAGVNHVMNVEKWAYIDCRLYHVCLFCFQSLYHV